MLEERTKDMSESEVTHLRRPSRLCDQRVNTHAHNLQVRHATVQNVYRGQGQLLTPIRQSGHLASLAPPPNT